MKIKNIQNPNNGKISLEEKGRMNSRISMEACIRITNINQTMISVHNSKGKLDLNFKSKKAKFLSTTADGLVSHDIIKRHPETFIIPIPDKYIKEPTCKSRL
jgi:hypothetical protein